MKKRIKVVNIAVILTLSMGFVNCSDSNDEPGASSEQINDNAIVQSITEYKLSGTINKIYEFEYDENNKVTGWIESDYWGTENFVIKKGKNTISVVEIQADGDSISHINYRYDNGFITKTPYRSMIYENNKLVKGEFSSIAWNGDNINSVIISGRKHEYMYNELLNNASINFNAFIEYNMSSMIDDEDGEEFIAFGLASGTRTKNLISEVETGYYSESDKYLGPCKNVYTYETDSNNRIVKITVTKDYSEYNGNVYVYNYEVTYK